MLEELVFNQHTWPAQPIQAGQPHPGCLTLPGLGDPGDQSSHPSPRSQAQPAAFPANEPAAQSLLLINSMSQAAGARGQTSV